MSESTTESWWADLPPGRVVYLPEVSAEAVSLALDPPPAGGPAALTLYPPATGGSTGIVKSALDTLDSVAIHLLPAWLPGAERIDGHGGAGPAAARSLATRLAAGSEHFGPFAADLAERAVRGSTPHRVKFSDEVRIVGLTKLIAVAYDRPRVALVVHVSEELSADQQSALVTAAEWLADRAGIPVWLTGARPVWTDRLMVREVWPAVAALAELSRHTRAPRPQPPAVTFPPLTGVPHAASAAEQRLEVALADQAWAAGRRWNHVLNLDLLAPRIRVDLLWEAAKLVVEIDGSDHRAAVKYANDRARDNRLQLAGFRVARFTNAQVFTDLRRVLRDIELFIRPSQATTLEG